MRIQFTSDLHLELAANVEFFAESPIAPKADVLILAGDIVEFPKRKAGAVSL